MKSEKDLEINTIAHINDVNNYCEIEIIYTFNGSSKIVECE